MVTNDSQRLGMKKTPFHRKAPMKRGKKPLRGGLQPMCKPRGERSQLVAEVDAVYAKLRKRQAELVSPHPGHIICFICGEPTPTEEAQLMHCEPRASMGTRYDDINCQPGCGHCNGKPLGNRAEFRRMLDLTFGPGTAERNEIRSKTVERMGTEYLRHLLEKFNTELKQLK